MNKKFSVKFRNEIVMDFEEGTTYKEISESFKKYFDYDILAARVNNDIVDLNDSIQKKCNIDFVDRSSEIGNSLYFNSAIFMLVLAVRNVLGEEAVLITEHSLDHGVCCSVKNSRITSTKVKEICYEMENIVSQNYLFTKLSVYRLDAIKYFKKLDRLDKVDVLKYISNTYINLYRINDLYDYFYGKMAYSTCQINNFKLSYINETNFVLSVPNTINPQDTLDYVHHDQLFKEFKNYSVWGKTIGIETAANLNKIVSEAKVCELVNLAEAHYDSQLAKISELIYNNANKIKIVFIAGPSSSGKTTTSKKLDIYLRSKGFITHPIALDDYFTNIEDRVKDENGNPDFESVKAVDVDLFNKNLTQLLEGKRVNIPTFNFILGKREYKDNYLELGERDIVIVEGLHALNETVASSIDKNQKYNIYICPLTQIGIDNHNYIHTSDVRKLRRIVRDSKTRGFGARDTLKMWPSIKSGEHNNIFRFQDAADIVLNSSLVYELGVLKTYVEPLLFNVNEDDPEYPEALRLINFLRNFLPIPSDDVPADSVLREFIGGSCFKG